MSINLGNIGTEAVKQLRMSDHWVSLMAAFEETARSKLHAALESPVEARLDATGYARALHDVYIALLSATRESPSRNLGKLSAKAEKVDV